jgi:hypothetical protein
MGVTLSGWRVRSSGWSVQLGGPCVRFVRPSGLKSEGSVLVVST